MADRAPGRATGTINCQTDQTFRASDPLDWDEKRDGSAARSAIANLAQSHLKCGAFLLECFVEEAERRYEAWKDVHSCCA